MTSPGDVVLSEELTDPGIKLLCSHYRLNLHGIAIDEGGIVPAGLEQACRNAKVRALFCIPNHHSPTLSVMAEGRRKEIAAIAEAYDLAVIENDTYGGFLEKPPGALARYAPERSFYFTSLSKIISPGLRLGFLAAPSGKLAELTSGLGATCWMVPQISAEVGALWIREGTAEHLAAWQRKEMVQRHEIVRATLPAADFSALPSSLHVWLTLPDPWRAEGLAQQLRQRGVFESPRPRRLLSARVRCPRLFASAWAVRRLRGPNYANVSKFSPTRWPVGRCQASLRCRAAHRRRRLPVPHNRCARCLTLRRQASMM